MITTNTVETTEKPEDSILSWISCLHAAEAELLAAVKAANQGRFVDASSHTFGASVTLQALQFTLQTFLQGVHERLCCNLVQGAA